MVCKLQVSENKLVLAMMMLHSIIAETFRSDCIQFFPAINFKAFKIQITFFDQITLVSFILNIMLYII